MTYQVKLYWAVGIVVLAVVVLTSQLVSVDLKMDVQDEYNSNAGELVADTLVGQTIRAMERNLSAVGIMFATYSGRANTGQLEFHVRESPDAPEDIRTSTAQVSDLKDNQFYRFEFEPIEESKGKTYFVFVTSTNSLPGSSVTVDIHTNDPYPNGSAYIVRGQGSDVTNPSVLRRSGKQDIDVSFELYYSVSIRQAIVWRTTNRMQEFISSWDENRGWYIPWIKVSWPIGVFVALLLIVQSSWYRVLESSLGKRGLAFGLLTFLFIVAIIFRLMYAQTLPITNDEGNYLYDARTLRQGSFAGGDGYVKAPLVIVWIALWQAIMGDTVFAGRLSSLIIGAITMVPLYYLAKELWGRRAGILAAGAWATFGAGVVFTIYIHTQPVALFFGISGLAVLLMALRGTTPRLGSVVFWEPPSTFWWFIVSGALLGLAVASRKSMLALGLVPILFVLLEGKSWKMMVGHLVSVGVGFIIVISLFLSFATYVYGTEGFWEALGVNSAEDGITSVDPAELEQVRAYSLRGMTPFFRESLPLILLSVLGLGFALERLVYNTTMLRGEKRVWLLSRFAWLPALGVLYWAWSFFTEYEGEAFMRFGIPKLWIAFFGIVLFIAFFHRQNPLYPPYQGDQMGISPDKGRRRGVNMEALKRNIVAALVVPVWIGGLAFFYMNWIKFHANYISEFIPPLVLLSSAGVLQMGSLIRKAESRLSRLASAAAHGIVVLVIAWSAVVSNYITFVYEHTGTFDLRSIQEAAIWARENIPINEPIFTGAAIVPYLSGHRVSLDIAHPRWYAYEFTRKDPVRLNTFLPSAEKMLEAFSNAKWFMLEQQTVFSFLMEYSEIEAGLVNDFEKVKEIENLGNPMTFYKRVQRDQQDQ